MRKKNMKETTKFVQQKNLKDKDKVRRIQLKQKPNDIKQNNKK